MICKNCGAQLPEDTLFCNHCGQSLAEPEKPLTCPSCGYTYRQGDLFCQSCGMRLQTTAQSPSDFTKSNFKPQNRTVITAIVAVAIVGIVAIPIYNLSNPAKKEKTEDAAATASASASIETQTPKETPPGSSAPATSSTPASSSQPTSSSEASVVEQDMYTESLSPAEMDEIRDYITTLSNTPAGYPPYFADPFSLNSRWIFLASYGGAMKENNRDFGDSAYLSLPANEVLSYAKKHIHPDILFQPSDALDFQWLTYEDETFEIAGHGGGNSLVPLPQLCDASKDGDWYKVAVAELMIDFSPAWYAMDPSGVSELNIVAFNELENRYNIPVGTVSYINEQLGEPVLTVSPSELPTESYRLQRQGGKLYILGKDPTDIDFVLPKKLRDAPEPGEKGKLLYERFRNANITESAIYIDIPYEVDNLGVYSYNVHMVDTLGNISSEVTYVIEGNWLSGTMVAYGENTDEYFNLNPNPGARGGA